MHYIILYEIAQQYVKNGQKDNIYRKNTKVSLAIFLENISINGL